MSLKKFMKFYKRKRLYQTEQVAFIKKILKKEQKCTITKIT